MVQAHVEGERLDEIKEYVDTRVISANEAAAGIFGFDVHRSFPPVTPLRLHLENEQIAVFAEGEVEAAVENPKSTELTAFFEFNRRPEEQSKERRLRPTYVEMPQKHTFCRGLWRLRKKGCDAIGRVHNPSPLAGDVVYLRMLLHHDVSRGATSFDELKLGKHTFKDACRHLGLLQDDGEWDMVLQKGAETCRSASYLRELFVIILRFCDPANPRQLFDNHWEEWCDDFKRSAGWTDLVSLHPEQSRQMQVCVLLDLEQRLQSWEVTLKDCQLPVPSEEDIALVGQRDAHLALPSTIREELDFDFEETAAIARDRLERMTTEQRAIFDVVMEHIEGRRPVQIFIDARGGCGKTFTLEGILAAARTSEPGGAVALAMATTGLAANLLPLGRTFHSRMKVGLNPTEEGCFAISAQSALARLICMARLLIIDEATLLDRRNLEKLERTLRDLTGSSEPWGGKIVILCGDFRQCLPIIPRASRASTVAHCLNRSYLWKDFRLMSLTKNMRVMADSEDTDLANFDSWAVSLGDGSSPTVGDAKEEKVKLPSNHCLEVEEDQYGKGMEVFCDKIYPNLATRFNEDDYFQDRAILAPTNQKRDAINEYLMSKLPTEEVVLLSADSTVEPADAALHPVEVLNSLNPQGLPSHRLTLRPGAPVRLMRNLNPRDGLCNGTRMKFVAVIDGKVGMFNINSCKCENPICR